MKKRSPAAVFLLPFITFGIYGLVWQVKTKNEMNKLGAEIPTAWLLVVPIISLYWLYKYCEGVEKVTGGKMSAVMAFILLALLSYIGAAIIQSDFNKLADGSLPLGPQQPAGVPGQPMPDNSFGGPVVAGGPVAPAATPAPVDLSQPVATQPVQPVAPAQPLAVSPPPQAAPVVTAPAPGQPFPPSDPTAQAPPQPPQNV